MFHSVAPYYCKNRNLPIRLLPFKSFLTVDSDILNAADYFIDFSGKVNLFLQYGYAKRMQKTQCSIINKVF
jgi:hypothetical protein